MPDITSIGHNPEMFFKAPSGEQVSATRLVLYQFEKAGCQNSSAAFERRVDAYARLYKNGNVSPICRAAALVMQEWNEYRKNYPKIRLRHFMQMISFD